MKGDEPRVLPVTVTLTMKAKARVPTSVIGTSALRQEGLLVHLVTPTLNSRLPIHPCSMARTVIHTRLGS